MSECSGCDLFFEIVINVGKSEFFLLFGWFLFFLFSELNILLFKTLVFLLKLFNFGQKRIYLILVDKNFLLNLFSYKCKFLRLLRSNNKIEAIVENKHFFRC